MNVWYYVHTKVNLLGFITENDKILRFIRIASTLDILKFIRIEVTFLDSYPIKFESAIQSESIFCGFISFNTQ